MLLGSALFAFFQLTGGNFQFLRFADGLALMSRLTFGFLSYEEFAAQALGVGAAVSAVTLLFWVAVLLLVVYIQNIILAIVAEAYEEAKSTLGTAETSFLMLVIMRIIFTCLFVIYRARMFCIDVLELITGRHFAASAVRQGSRTASGQAGGSAPDLGGGGGGGGPGVRSNAPGAAPSFASGAGAPCCSFKAGSDRLASPFEGGVSSSSNAAPDSQLLAPTMSYMPLPPDVESRLRRSPHSTVPQRQLGASRAASRDAGSRLRSFHVVSGKVVTQGSLKDPADAAHAAPAVEADAGGSDFAKISQQLQQPQQTASLRQCGRNLWQGMFGERHDVRMYKDLLLKQHRHDEGWIATWKCKYWLPWCISRTRPVKILMNLYQEFTSYKLRYVCTWDEADKWGRRVFDPDEAAASSNIGLDHTSILPPVSPLRDLPDSACCSAAAAGFGRSSLPPLHEDTYVDKATLSRLFLVSSYVPKMCGCWASLPPP
ncbi:hypothetical protein COO60DRAFT_259439 [Scenedesmus sp. NREL 46B-D3]|nr:hypothetical protein COO60DRAFT_259439 [Scenedesmus sp. NREL 46B-D3]